MSSHSGQRGKAKHLVAYFHSYSSASGNVVGGNGKWKAKLKVYRCQSIGHYYRFLFGKISKTPSFSPTPIMKA